MFKWIKKLFKKKEKACRVCVAHHALAKAERVKSISAKKPTKKPVGLAKRKGLKKDLIKSKK